MISNQLFLDIISNFYNQFFPILFIVLKYTLVFILLLIGLIFLLRLRGILFKQTVINLKSNNNHLKSVSIFLGLTYIVLAFGIMFNYLIYLLIWIFKPYKGFLFIMIENIMKDSFYLRNYIHPFIALGSFLAIVQYFLALFYFTNNKYVINKPRKSGYVLVCSVLEILLFGFECLPYLLT